MEILGIGPLELLFILLIALIVLGPQDMVKAGRTLGRFLRRLVMSSEWRTFQQASRDLRYLPNRLIREAGLEEEEEVRRVTRQEAIRELRQDLQEWQRDISAWTTPPPPVNILEDNPSAARQDTLAKDSNSNAYLQTKINR